MPAQKPIKPLKRSPQPVRPNPVPSSKKSAKRRKAAPRTTSGRKPPQPIEPRAPLWSRLSLDQKLDLLGILLTLTGLSLGLILLSPKHGAASETLVSLLRRGFGWGGFLFPLVLMTSGIWLILRRFERLPRLSAARGLGFVLTFAGLLTLLHLLASPADRPEALALAGQGEGGGYLGAFLFLMLTHNFGNLGATIALTAWLLIALALLLDTSVLDLFHWATPLLQRLISRLKDQVTKAIASLRKPASPAKEDGSKAPSPAAMSQGTQSLPFVSLSNPREQPPKWVLPSIADILENGGAATYDEEVDRHRAQIIEETLASFGAPAKVVEINRGPTITQFGVEPAFIETRGGRMRVRVSKIAALADDLALALAAKRIRIQAPVPSKNFVGIEVPNEEIALVRLRQVVESEAFQRIQSPLRIALGQDVAGNPVAADLAAMPHLLIAGTTGSGKSVCVNSIICCLLLHNTPDSLRLIMVDPKRVELTGYNGIPHLLAPVVVELERVVGALQWIAREMDQRYHKLARAGARNINDYNARLSAGGEKPIPHLVVIIDELADLMMLAPDETERTITRLAQLARATGIHLVIATQRPSVDVVTGLIKANFPARIAFAVASGVDSRVILDQPGAERLLGRGDMLFQAPDAAAPLRLQGTFVTEAEIQRLVTYWRSFSSNSEAYTQEAIDALPSGIPLKQMSMWEDMAPEENLDPLYNEAVDLVRRQGRASISLLQRRLRIGYTRAARLIETMQAKGIVAPTQPGAPGLEVLDYGPAAPPADER
jgi:S-DNA-T family DNA segregation ATPase FtsK/SpoIIIE